MLERKHVAFYARSSGVSEVIAERDVVLTYVLRILSDNILSQLAFKGGTCLKKTHFGKTGRFSMDLDFTSTGIELEELRNGIKQKLNNKTHYDLDFRITDENVGLESYLAIVEYAHSWNSGSKFELQISYRGSPILPIVELPLFEEMYFKFCEFQSFLIRILQKEELLAEKIRAAFQRIRSRDLYDLYLFAERPYNKEIVKALVVIKCWNVRDPFYPQVLLDKVEEASYDWDDLQSLVRRGSLPSQKTVINTVLKSYTFLDDLDEQLLKIVEDAKKHRESKLMDKFLTNLRERKQP